MANKPHEKFIIYTHHFHAISGVLQEKYAISGKIEESSFHQGGAYREPIPDVFPKRTFTMVLVKFVGRDSIPQIVQNFTTDDEGNFSITVPAGNYGFVLVDEEIKAFQYLPSAYHKQDERFNTESSRWTLNGKNPDGPLKVRDTHVTKIVITHHFSSSCGMCP